MSEDTDELGPLTDEAVMALPEGAPITVIWSGGNGPHEYMVIVDSRGERYAWANDLDAHDRLRFHNPLTFVGTQRFHTRVWAGHVKARLTGRSGDV